MFFTSSNQRFRGDLYFQLNELYHEQQFQIVIYLMKKNKEILYPTIRKICYTVSFLFLCLTSLRSQTSVVTREIIVPSAIFSDKKEAATAQRLFPSDPDFWLPHGGMLLAAFRWPEREARFYKIDDYLAVRFIPSPDAKPQFHLLIWPDKSDKPKTGWLETDANVLTPSLSGDLMEWKIYNVEIKTKDDGTKSSRARLAFGHRIPKEFIGYINIELTEFDSDFQKKMFSAVILWPQKR